MAVMANVFTYSVHTGDTVRLSLGFKENGNSVSEDTHIILPLPLALELCTSLGAAIEKELHQRSKK